MYNTEKFEKGLEDLGITLSEKQIGQFLKYYEILVEWNSFMNLTGITEFEEVITKHFLDSLAVVTVCDPASAGSVIDIGTGAGFPGLPLKILQLGLDGIRTIHGRAEDFARDQNYRESFDLCVSRAVANLSSLSEYCLPYTALGGRFISYKSGKIDEELAEAEKAIRVLGGETENVVKFNLADTDMERSFVVIEKKRHTPKAYPRKAGLPGKEPIR